MLSLLDSVCIPKSISDAFAHSGWQATMFDAMQALADNETWVLVLLAPVG